MIQEIEVVQCQAHLLSSCLAMDWLHHASHAELQVRNLLAEGANLLADFVKCLSHLRAEWACIALQFRIDHLYKRDNQVQLSTKTDNTNRFAEPSQRKFRRETPSDLSSRSAMALNRKETCLDVQQLLFILKTTT